MAGRAAEDERALSVGGRSRCRQRVLKLQHRIHVVPHLHNRTNLAPPGANCQQQSGDEERWRAVISS